MKIFCRNADTFFVSYVMMSSFPPLSPSYLLVCYFLGGFVRENGLCDGGWLKPIAQNGRKQRRQQGGGRLKKEKRRRRPLSPHL